MDTEEGGNNDGFNASRAALFEALSHPNRVRILSALSRDPLSFAELKREVGIESSGHLSFHLAKLHDLTKMTPEGKYSLNEDGREALRLMQAVNQRRDGIVDSGQGINRNSARRKLRPTMIFAVAFLISVVSLSFLAAMAYEQNLALQSRIDQLNGRISGQNEWIVSLNLNISNLRDQVAVWKTLASRFNSTTILRQFTVTEPGPQAGLVQVASFEARYGGYVWINGTGNMFVGIGYHSSHQNMTYDYAAGLGSGLTLFPIPGHFDISPDIVYIYVQNGSYSNQTAIIDVTYFFMPTYW